jgi:hypothetical protein
MNRRLHSCQSCGLLGRRRYRRARRARALADQAHVEFFTRLGAELRAERAGRLWAERGAIWSGRGEITINADYVPPDPQAAWWLPELAGGR